VNLDQWYYFGAIVAQAGMALLAIGLVLVSVSKLDASKKQEYNKYFAIVAFVFLVIGIAIQLSRLLSVPS